MTFSVSYAQEPNVLNKYKYVYIPQLYYDKGKADIYGIRKTVADKLNACRVPLIFEEDKIPMEAMKNPCLMIQCMANNVPSKKGPGFSDIKILFFDCKNDTVLNCSAVANLRFNLMIHAKVLSRRLKKQSKFSMIITINFLIRIHPLL